MMQSPEVRLHAANGDRSRSAPSVNEIPATRVVIGVLTWNGYEKARACIASFSRLREWPVTVVVVDNGSAVPEGQRLASEFGAPVYSIRLEPNAKVAGGYNAAVRWAAEHDATHVLLLNNDTIVQDRDLLRRLILAMEPDVAAVGPMVLNADGTIYSAGGRIHWVTGWSRHEKGPVMLDGPYTVEWLDGPCMLISLEAVRRIGGFAPVFISYWEDVDWCVRASRSGYRCLVEPRASIVHLRGGSIPSAEGYAFSLRNAILFIRRNGSALNNATTIAYYVFRRAPAMLFGRKRLTGRSLVPMRAVWEALAWNVRDARRHGHWRLAARGPSIEEMPEPSRIYPAPAQGESGT
jgi:GT2 family glycosyltransferase